MRASTLARVITGVACALAATACESSTGNDGTFTISTNATANVAQGGTSNVTVTIARNDFDAPVTLSADGLPTGVSAVFTPATVPGTSAVLQFEAAGTATPATSTITIRANGEGVAEQTATLALTVTVTGSFTLGALEPAVTVAQGGGANTSVLVSRVGGFGAAVGMTFTGEPAGLTVTPGSASTTSNALPVTLAASGAVPVGSYTLTATGTSSGVPDQQTSITVNVIAAPATSALTLTFCNAPVWFAYRNEGFSWQAATAGISVSFEATERLAVAFTFTSATGGNKQTEIWYASRADLALFDGSDCLGTKTVNGSVAGLSAGQVAEVVMYTSAANPRPSGTSLNFSLSNLPDRPLDLVATSGAAGSGFFTSEKIILRRALNPTSGTTLPVLDFGTAEAVALAQSTVTINNVSSADEKLMVNTFRTSLGTMGRVQFAALSSGSAVFKSVPVAQQVAGDAHELFLDAYQGNAGVGRTLFAYYSTPGDRTENMGPFLNVPLLTTLSTTPYLRLRARLDAQSEYGTLARFSFFQGLAPSDTRLVYFFLSSGYYGATPAVWDAALPDLSDVPGFNASWMLTPGQSVEWDVWGYGARSALLFGGAPVVGDLILRSDRAFLTSAPALRAPRAASVADPFGRRQYFKR